MQQARPGDAIDSHGGVLRNRHSGRSDAARGQRLTRFVEEGDLFEFAELEDVVLENSILLPGLQSGFLQVGA